MFKTKYSNFCKNCGKNHSTNECTELRISSGIIAYRYNSNKIEYLLICRRDTFGFVEFIRGNYSLNNINYIQRLINEMTISEKNKILNLDFEEIWKLMWSNAYGLNNRCEKKISKKKYYELLNGIKNIKLKDIINNSNTSWVEPEWGFPKGRKNNLENNFNCALREFEEETGYSKYNINIIKNVIPYEEIFTGSNYKCYKNIYYLANINYNENPIYNYQKTEVSSIKWCSYDEVISKIRPYDFEKKKMINNINNILNILNEYTIYNI